MPAGQVTVTVTMPQRAQMTQIGAHHGQHRLTCRPRQIGGTARCISSVPGVAVADVTELS
jgi:hypothetical protein